VSDTGPGDRDGVSGHATAAWSRTEALTFALFVAGVLVSLFFLVHPWYDRTNDGSTYIITARALAAGEGYTYLGELFRIRPPGFSAILYLFVGEGGTLDFGALNLLVSLFGAAGVVLLYLYQRAYVGWVPALLTSIAVWLNPGYRRLCNQVMSDVPGVALVLACLLVERWASRRPSWTREVVLGLAIGAGAWVRSITLLLVPAILLARGVRRWRGAENGTGRGTFVLRRLVLFAVVSWLVVLPWTVVKNRSAPPPPADQTLNYSIATAMWHTDPGDPGSPRRSLGQILQRIPSHVKQAAVVVGSRMQHRIPGSAPTGGAVALGRAALALLLLAGTTFVLVRRAAPAEWFVGGVLLVVAVYFVFTDRLVLPVFVLALAATVEALRDVSRWLGGERAARVVPLVALLVLIAVDFHPRRDWRRIETRHRELVATAAAIESAIEPDARLAASRGFHYGVYLNRPVFSLVHAIRRARSYEAAEEVIDRYGIDTVVSSPLVPPDLSPYFLERYGPGTPAGTARVWRVRTRIADRPGKG
jgi:hypothetical protein